MPDIGDIARGQDIGKGKGIKYQWLACAECGLERWVWFNPTHPPAQRCRKCGAWTPGCRAHQARLLSIRSVGAGNYQWKGGQISDGRGYTQIKLMPDDFFFPMAQKSRYVLEHRLVMAKHLGRCLHRWEIVHHRNHIRTDNRIENLQIVSDVGHNQISILERRIAILQKENQALREKLQSIR